MLFPSSRSLEIDGLADLGTFYPKLQGFRFNHVVSAKGRAATSDEVSTKIDRQVLKAIRASSDLIITTGRTARAEQLRSSEFAPLLILTREKMIDCPAVTVTSNQKVLITNSESGFPNEKAFGVGNVTGLLASWISEFCSINRYQHVVVETGLATAKELFGAGLIDEFCLTVTGAQGQTESDNKSAVFLTALGLTYDLMQLLEIDGNYFYKFNLRKSSIAL
jgi:riboflavin biosynthesis pyrimidine reductase